MGERFGNYELIEKVAVGGMAEIFKARAVHGKGVEKLVCIKRIHPALSADKVFVAMFIDEARLGVSMVHGNIVSTFDFGYVDGHYFLAMEYVEGNDLATLCGRARVLEIKWPPQLAIFVIMQILEGLTYAHKKRDDKGRPLQLVHRDVSPSNVLVSKDGQVKLLDFGIARSQAREFETRTGVIKGKPGYMSPEQAAGGEVDSRADVWSCGAVLYELITGERLKDGRKSTGDPQLDEVLDRALAADRDGRYMDASQLSRALTDILEEKNWRVYARDLRDFIQRVDTSKAPGQDWDMKSEAVEEHLAAALESVKEGLDRENSGTLRITGATEAGEPGTVLTTTTEDLGTNRRGSRKKTALALAVLAVIAGVAATLILGLNGDPPQQATPDPGPGEAQSEESGEADPPQKAEPAVFETIIASNPDGAKIHLDHRILEETTPAKLSLQAGEHTLKLSLPGHEDVETKFQVGQGLSNKVEFSLEAILTTLTISTKPKGALIQIDGVDKGAAPLTVDDLPPGEHLIVAAMEGRQKTRETVSTAKDRPAQLQIVLPPKAKATIPQGPPAILSINTNPWTNALLDGNNLGNTPVSKRRISPGRHRLVLSNAVYNIHKTITFTVKPGEKKLIREDFKR